MKIKIGMMYDDRVPFGREVEKLTHDWAWKHDYAFICQNALPDPTLDPYWNRLPFIQQNLNDCDWFVWFDADVIIVNQDRPLDLPADKNIAFSQDYNGLCCGAFAVRNCDWSRRLLDAWLLVGSVGQNVYGLFDWNFMREQTTMKTLFRLFPAVRSNIGDIPETVIQNMYSPYSPSALAIHTWAGWTGPNMVQKVLARLKDGGWRQRIME